MSIVYAWEAPPYVWTGSAWQLQHSENAGYKDVDLYSVTLMERDSANHGVIVDFFQKLRRMEGMGPEMTMLVFERSIKGYADDNGGFLMTRHVEEDADPENPLFGNTMTYFFPPTFLNQGPY